MSVREITEIFREISFKGQIKFNQPMSAHTSLKVGGPVEIMVFPEDILSLKNVLVAAGREKISIFVLGAGTNLLVQDGGIEGIVVSLKAFDRIEIIKNINRLVQRNSQQESSDAFTGLFVKAGVPLNSVVNFAKKNGYSGIEALAGIPGTFGGGVYMNAGSFNTEIKDVIVSVALMRLDGSIVNMRKDELKFSYRCSNIPSDTIILSANIILKKDTTENISARINGFLKKKKSSQPIGEFSAGCVFKNPEGDFAGRLIEVSGCKGMRVGDAEVSIVHANYFINKGEATCRDFIKLMTLVRKSVEESTGITLKPEIKIIGREG